VTFRVKTDGTHIKQIHNARDYIRIIHLVFEIEYLSVAILMFCETRWKLDHHLWGKLRPDGIQPQNKSDYKSNKLWKLVTRYNTLFLLFIVQICSTIPVYCTGSLQDNKETIHSFFPFFQYPMHDEALRDATGVDILLYRFCPFLILIFSSVTHNGWGGIPRITPHQMQVITPSHKS
jgi:hypothetical protein